MTSRFESAAMEYVTRELPDVEGQERLRQMVRHCMILSYKAGAEHGYKEGREEAFYKACPACGAEFCNDAAIDIERDTVKRILDLLRSEKASIYDAWFLSHNGYEAEPEDWAHWLESQLKGETSGKN